MSDASCVEKTNVTSGRSVHARREGRGCARRSRSRGSRSARRRGRVSGWRPWRARWRRAGAARRKADRAAASPDRSGPPVPASGARARRARGAATPARSSGYSTFSYAVRTGTRLNVWKMKPRVSRRSAARRCSGTGVTSTLSITIRPPSGLSMQPIRFSSVVLPLPDGPASAMKSPRSMVRSMSASARTRTSPSL